MSHRFNRVLDLGLLAKDMVSMRRGKNGPDSVQRRQKVIRRLGSLNGLPQKLGQILSLNDLGESQSDYKSLTEGSGVLSCDEVYDLILHEWGKNWSDVFSHFNPDGISASLSQVHSAELKDGRRVAVKIQYPSIAASIDLDIKALGWLSAPLGDLRKGFDVKGYRKEVASMLQTEINFTKEAEHLRLFSHLTKNLPWIQTPDLVNPLNSDRILTMTWIDGLRFDRVLNWPGSEQKIISRRLLQLFLTSCFKWKSIHADPHQGNYRFLHNQGDPVIGLLDFGCVKSMPIDFVDGLRRFISSHCDHQVLGNDKVFEILHRMGFNSDLLYPAKRRLSDLSEVLFTPFRQESFRIGDWNLSERVADVLGEHRMNFRIAGPPQMLYFIRAYQGLIQYLKALNCSFDWVSITRTILSDLEPDAPDQDDIPQRNEESMKSESLHIQVKDRERETVKLVFGAGAAQSLPDLVPMDLRPRLESRSIDLRAISQTAVVNDFSPGELFHLQDGEKQIRVWLE